MRGVFQPGNSTKPSSRPCPVEGLPEDLPVLSRQRLGHRIIGVNVAQLQTIPEVIGLAYGAEKTAAVRAALVGGYLTGIVTHTSFARTLLAGAT